jgi:hypothetical protein
MSSCEDNADMKEFEESDCDSDESGLIWWKEKKNIYQYDILSILYSNTQK